MLQLRVLVALLLAVAIGEAGIIGLTIDVEDYDDQALYLATVGNASAATAAANLSLRFSATVPPWVAWTPGGGPGQEAFHQQIMSAVDEVIIMDYGTACHRELSTAALPCNPAFAHGLAMPFITAAQILSQSSAGKTQCLVTVGLGVDATPPHWEGARFHTESEIESFLTAGETLMRSCGMDAHSCMSQPGWPGSEGGPFNHFALFESGNYENATAYFPCAGDDPACAGGHRTGKAVWMYDYTPVADPRRQREFLDFCAARRVTELYVGATCNYLRGCENACNVHPATAPRPRPNASTEAQLTAFIRSADAAGISLQLYAGEIIGAPTLQCTKACLRLARTLQGSSPPPSSPLPPPPPSLKTDDDSWRSFPVYVFRMGSQSEWLDRIGLPKEHRAEVRWCTLGDVHVRAS